MIPFSPLYRKQHKRAYVFTKSALYCCPILTKSGVPGQIFVEVPNTTFHENQCSGRRTDTCWQTDGHGKANWRFLRLCDRTKTHSNTGFRRVEMSSWLFCDVPAASTGSYRRFGTTYRLFLDWLTLDDGTDRWSRNVGNYKSTTRNIPEERRSSPRHIRMDSDLNTNLPLKKKKKEDMTLTLLSRGWDVKLSPHITVYSKAWFPSAQYHEIF
jgi:hypothetical protein